MDPLWPTSVSGLFEEPLDNDAYAALFRPPSSYPIANPSPMPRPTPSTSGLGNSLSSTADANAGEGSDRERVHGGYSVLPPLPQGRSPLVRSSSPRHHSSTTTTAAYATLPPLDDNSTPNRHRRPSPPYWSRAVNFAEAPLDWGEDSLFVGLGDAVVPNVPNSDDQYLSAFADNDFSSPSTYPALSSLHAPSSSQYPSWYQAPTAIQAPAQASAPNPHGPHHASASNLGRAAPSRTATQLTNSSLGDSQNPIFADDLFGDDDDDHVPESPLSSYSDAMPPQSLRKRRRIAAAPQRAAPGATAVKRRPESPNPVVIKDLEEDEEDVFGDTPEKRASDADSKTNDAFTTIDLTEANEVPEDLGKPEEDNRVKIASFQCVICMDDVTTLTVTHCGHLFCAHCLHQSLHVEATKGKCPMCRTRVDMKPRQSYGPKTKGSWPLELKLMTATRKGKRKADTLT